MKARKVQLISTQCNRLWRKYLRAIILRTEFVYAPNLHEMFILETVIYAKWLYTKPTFSLVPFAGISLIRFYGSRFRSLSLLDFQ
jgi:hypothetical protein